MILTYHWLTGRSASYVHALHRKYGKRKTLSPPQVNETV